MRTPEALISLVEYGVIDEVVRPLMSGKEAQIYLVIAGGERRVAKIYKEAQQRSFKHRAEYTEGRKTRNSRDQRAMGKHTRHGRAQDEAAWRSAEVDAIYRLQAAGVRVPQPYNYIDGVLVMELVTDGDGHPAPRLGDLSFEPHEARHIFDHLLGEVVRMLCAGLVHGDLSDFNVLMAADGPVVIDFPQAVDAASNQSARKLLLRDVDNLYRFLDRYAPLGRPPLFAQEMWDLYQSNLLTPETKLLGRHAPSTRPANTREVLALIGAAERDAQRQRAALQPGRGRKVEVIINPPPRAPNPAAAQQRGPQQRGPQQRGPRPANNHQQPIHHDRPAPRPPNLERRDAQAQHDRRPAAPQEHNRRAAPPPPNLERTPPANPSAAPADRAFAPGDRADGARPRRRRRRKPRGDHPNP